MSRISEIKIIKGGFGIWLNPPYIVPYTVIVGWIKRSESTYTLVKYGHGILKVSATAGICLYL